MAYKVPFSNLKAFYQDHQPEVSEAVLRVCASGWYLLGEEIKKFESSYAEYCEAKYCLGVANGLQALELALKAVGVGIGHEVIVPAHTFVATALAVTNVGATPVFCDVDDQTFNMDIESALKRVSGKTAAFLPVHLYGRPFDVEALQASAGVVPIVEDNAQAQGAHLRGKITGGMGAAAGTSFYPGKNIGAFGDAGAVTTNDENIAKKITSLRNYGQTVKYHHDLLGTNSRLSEIQAAILSIKLKYLEAVNLRRAQIAGIYSRELAKLPDLRLPEILGPGEHVFHQYVVRTERRDDLKKFLEGQGVEVLIHYPIPVHLQKAYDFLGYKKGDFPKAEKICGEILSLPIYPEMSDADAVFVAEHIRRFFSLR